MLIFYILSLFLLLGALIPRKKQNVYFYISFCILFVLSAFRGINVGTDTIHYKEMYKIIARGAKTFIEPSWLYLNQIVADSFGDFRYILIISALLVLGPVFYVVKKISYNPLLSIFIYFTLYIYLQSFNIMRQLIAVSIVFVGIFFIVKKWKPWLYIIFVLLATSFHVSALLALPLVLVKKIPNKKNVYISATILAMIIGLFFISPISSKFSDLLGYQNYLHSHGMGNLVGNALFLIILNSFFLFVLFTCKSRNILFKLFFIYVIGTNLTQRVYLGSRLIFYFTIFQIIFLPFYLYNNKLKDPTLPIVIVIVYCYILFYRSIGAGEIIPYSNILFN